MVNLACPEAARRIEPLEPLERTGPVMNATVETVGLISFKIVQYLTVIRFEPAYRFSREVRGGGIYLAKPRGKILNEVIADLGR